MNKPDHRLEEDTGKRSSISAPRDWVEPTLTRLSIRQTRSGVFCTTQETFDNQIVDFFFGSDPECIIG